MPLMEERGTYVGAPKLPTLWQVLVMDKKRCFSGLQVWRDLPRPTPQLQLATIVRRARVRRALAFSVVVRELSSKLLPVAHGPRQVFDGLARAKEELSRADLDFEPHPITINRNFFEGNGREQPQPKP